MSKSVQFILCVQTAILFVIMPVASSSEQLDCVPDLTGRRFQHVPELVAEMSNVTIGKVTERYDYYVPKAWMLEQTPPAGTPIKEGEIVTVDLVVSLGREPAVYASLSTTEYYGFVPFHVRFFENSRSTVNKIERWEWDFGDGKGSSEQKPEHTYTEPGVYTVSLTVTTTAQETDTATDENMIVAMAAERGIIGPDGGSIKSPGGASYTVAKGMFKYNLPVCISDTPEAAVRKFVSKNIPYHGAVTVLIDSYDRSAISEDYHATIIIPLREPLPPGKELDAYVGLSYGYGQSRNFDEKAIVNEDGLTAILIAKYVGTIVVRVSDEYSIPQLGEIQGHP